MARNFCLTKEQIDTLKPKMKSVGGVALANMSGAQRQEFFTEALGNRMVGKELASTFEQALISKQKTALKNWAKNVFTAKEQKDKGYSDVIGKIDRLSKEGALSPTATNEYLENLVATALGVDLKPAEIKKINELSEKITAAALLKPDNEFGIPNIAYFKAREEMNDYLQSITPAPLLDVISGIIGRGNLLASIKSPVTNIISNISGLMTEPIVRRAIARKASGVNADLVVPFIKHAHKVYKETGYDVVRMLQLQDESKTLGEGRTTTQGEGNIRAVARFYEDLIFKKAMGTPDVLAAAFHFIDSVNVNSTKLADTMGLTGEEHKKKARELMLEATALNPNSKVEPAALREQGIHDALYATYQDPSWLSEMALKVRTTLDNASGGLNLGTNLEPFVKTPANVVKTSLEYSGVTMPFVIARLPNALHEAKKGNPAPLRELSRTAVRAGIGLTLAALIASMLDDDSFIPDYVNATPRDRELVRLNNAAYNSIRVGDYWVSLDYFGVLGAAVAGFAAMKGRDDDVVAFSESVFAQVQRVPVVSKVFDMYAWYDQNKRYQKTPEEISGELFGGLINDIYVRTVPMIISDFGKAADDSQRANDYEDHYDEIIAQMPFLRETLPPKYNDLGEIMPTESALFTILFGARVKTANSSEVLAEINRLNEKGIDVTLSAARIAEMTAAKEILSFEEYNDFQGQVQANITSVYAKLIETSAYKKADPAEQEKMLEETRKKVVQTTARNEGYYSRINQQIKDEKKRKKEEEENEGK